MVKLLDEIRKLLESVESPWLTITEASAYIKCSPSTIRKMYGLGLIKRYRAIQAAEGAKKGWVYSKTELDEALKKNRASVLERI